jgi:hypothetical protein
VNPRATLTLLLVTVLVVGALFYLRLHTSTTREATEAERYAAVFDAEQIDGIDLVRGSETVSLRRDNGSWRLVSPVADRADPEAVDRLLMTARFLKVRDRQIDPDSAALAEAGLTSPRLRLELRGRRPVRIDLGGPTALPEEIFARVDSAPVLLRVPDTLATLATAPTKSFRDPRLTGLTADDIEKFTVRRADGEMTLRFERGRWLLEKPVATEADSQVVRSFLELILGVRVEGFAATEPEAAGLLPGQSAVISLTPTGGGQDLDIEVLRRSTGDDETLFARFAPRGGTLQVDTQALALFKVSPEALRDRSLGRVEPDAVDRITIESDGQTLRLVRDGDGWADGDSGAPHAAADIAELIEAYNQVRIASFLPGSDPEEAGLERPAAAVTFHAWLSENTPEEPAGGHVIAGVRLGRADEDGFLHAQTHGSTGIVTIPPDLGDLLRGLSGQE